jgi:FMN phosphatase YigB (HAD superfamily)
MPVHGRLDGLFLSYEAGFITPDPAFFTQALARFGLDPRGCLFLDDRADNVEVARSVGLRAFQIRGDAQEAERFLRAEGVALAADDSGPAAGPQKS